MIIFTNIVEELRRPRRKNLLKPVFVSYLKNTGASMGPVILINNFKKKATRSADTRFDR